MPIYYPDELQEYGINPHPARAVIFGRMPMREIARHLDVSTASACRILLGQQKPTPIAEYRLRELAKRFANIDKQ